MRHKKVKLSSLLIFGMGLTGLQAQEAVSAAGGNATGSSGTVSYTVGQVAYITTSASSGTITQGVQQPFEIMIVTGIEDANDINLDCSAYPNPATGFVNLKVNNYNMENLIYQLFDMNGKLILIKKVDGNETIIPMENLVPSTYILRVTENNKDVKTFKIIKN
jgi:hypothetical protein